MFIHMNVLFSKSLWLYLFFIIVAFAGGWYVYQNFISTNGKTETETALVETGTIEQTVTVSGKIEAKKIARLGFPFSGTIQNIYKSAGDNVTTNEVIASLTSDTLIAEYSAALERVRTLEQAQKQLMRGATYEEKKVASTNVQIATTKLSNAEANFAQLIKNAKKSLLSTDLAAYPVNTNNNDTPPTISGSYTCAEEGTYELSLFSSNSGLSYYLSGLSSGTFTASFDSPAPLGECGLYIQFVAGEKYSPGKWTVELPNKRSTNYITLKNTYDLAVVEAESNIKSAKEALDLAKDSEEVLLASATPESLSQAEGRASEARAQLLAQEARISDYTVRAPFDGIITDVNMKVGEPTNPNNTITIVYEGEYELRARIPEIDITKVKIGNRVKAIFDAAPNESLPAVITFISPISSDVGGVAYYEAIIKLDQDPSWLREGLNADVIIESQKKEKVPTLPKRFLVKNANGTFVLQKSGEQIIERPVTIGLISTDGFAEMIDLPIGEEVLLP